MIVQNNHSPLVFLVLVILGGAVLLGFLLTGIEALNPTRTQQEAFAAGTQADMQAKATQAAWSGTQTQQAIADQHVQTQTAIPGQATVIPAQQTAAAATAQGKIEQGNLNGTLQAQHAEQWLNDQKSFGTATAIAGAQERDAVTNRKVKFISGLELLILCLVVMLLVLAIAFIIRLSIKIA